MPCLICGDPNTVRSHLFPKAFVRKIRNGAPNAVVLKYGAERPRFVTGGLFDDNLLCSTHEGVTGELDRYGVAFVRRVEIARKGSTDSVLHVANPEPIKLCRFAQSIVWRSVASEIGMSQKDELGPRLEAVQKSIFDGEAINSPLLVMARAYVYEGGEADLIFSPKKRRLDGLSVWSFQMPGCNFLLHVGNGDLPKEADAGRADRLTNPVIVNVGDQPAIGDQGIARVFGSIRRHLGPTTQ